MDDILLNKASIIERCLKRIREEYENDPSLENYTHQDALILNLERACQASIDMAMHICAKEHLGIPQNSADAFVRLKEANKLSEETTQAMILMTGFRNRAVHLYQKLDLTILKKIVETHLEDFVKLAAEMGVRIV